MKAAILKALGQPLLLEDIPEPVPGAGEVLVRVLAAPVGTYAQEVFRGKRPYPLVLPPSVILLSIPYAKELEGRSFYEHSRFRCQRLHSDHLSEAGCATRS